MALRENPFGEVRVPLAWTAGVALVVAIIVAVGLLMSDRRETFRSEAYCVTRQVGDAEPYHGNLLLRGLRPSCSPTRACVGARQRSETPIRTNARRADESAGLNHTGLPFSTSSK